MLFDPDAHIGDGELQVLAEAIRAGSEAAGSPVVDRRHRHAEMGSQFADVEQGSRPQGLSVVECSVLMSSRRGAPTRDDRRQPARSPTCRGTAAGVGRRKVKKMGL